MVAAVARRAARRLALGLRAATARIHAPVFWRALYAVFEARWFVGVASAACRAAARLEGTTPVAVADRAVPLLETGWPHHPGTPWVNLNVQRLHRRVADRLAPRPNRASSRPPRAAAERLRVGVLGNLEGAFFFTPPFFAARPDGVDLLAFDLGSQTPAAEPSVAPLVERYERFTLAQVDELGRAVTAAGLDVLLADVRKPHVYELLDLVDTPCVALLCAEVYLRYHQAVSFHLYPFQQADYFPVGTRLFCGTSASWFGDEPIVPAFFPYDLRGLDPAARAPWREREPLIVFHGRLFKVSPPFLDVVFGLLEDDPELRFVLIGNDSAGALERILAAAAGRRLERRVSYEGPLSSVQDEQGRPADPSWRTLFDLLARARLAPDPWPLAGGATRVEAYAAGAPTAHMGIRTDPDSWGRPQPMVTAEHVALLVPRATAYWAEEYRRICRRALYEEAFADSVADEQAEIAARVGDPRAFWRLLLDAHERWRAGRAA